MAYEPAKDGIGNASHGSKDGGRRDDNRANAHLRRNPYVIGHRVLPGVVPVLLNCEAFASH